MKQRSAFVTGASGCIGSALTARLSAEGLRVAAMVRDRKRADHLSRLPGVVLIESSLESPDVILEAMRGCDLVFHLAAKVHAAAETPESEFVRVNVDGTKIILDAAIESGVEALVFFSTVAVYAESEGIVDEDSLTAPATFYGASKLAAEKIVLDATSDSLKTTVLRLPVVYGARDRGNVARLIEAIRRGHYFIIGDGDNLKSMVAVGNAVDAAMRVAGDERSRGRIYNVCDARAYSQREIAETIAKMLGRSERFIRLHYTLALAPGYIGDKVKQWAGIDLPLTTDRVRKLANNARFSSSRIETELGFYPRLSLPDGLAEAIESISVERTAAPGSRR